MTRVGSRESAFALVELLVVIAVVALLALLVYVLVPSSSSPDDEYAAETTPTEAPIAKTRPVLSASELRKRKIRCAANLRIIALGVMQYCNEYNDWLPMACAETRQPGGARGTTTYCREISPYIACENHAWFSGAYSKPGAPAILTCPSERTDFGKGILGYGWNWTYLGSHKNPAGAMARPGRRWNIRRKVSEVMRPDEMSIIGESRPMKHFANPLEATLWWGGGYRSQYYIADRHKGGANYVCADGRIEFATYDDLVDDWKGAKRVFSRDR